MYRKPAAVEPEEDINVSDLLDHEQQETRRVMFAVVRNLCERAADASVDEARSLLIDARYLYNCAAHQADEDDDS